jgi:hypothetical protein
VVEAGDVPLRRHELRKLDNMDVGGFGGSDADNTSHR